MTAVVADVRSTRTLISPQLFDRLAERIVKDEGIDRDLAERIMDQTLAFLCACAANPGESLAPSPTVDIGWHVFILYTEDYAVFCQDIAGWFIPAWVDVAFLLLRLVEAGHHPQDAEMWARSLSCFSGVDRVALNAFSAYVAGLWSYWAISDDAPGVQHRARIARDYAAWRLPAE